jgi:hypothetical protein
MYNDLSKQMLLQDVMEYALNKKGLTEIQCCQVLTCTHKNLVTSLTLRRSWDDQRS